MVLKIKICTNTKFNTYKYVHLQRYLYIGKVNINTLPAEHILYILSIYWPLSFTDTIMTNTNHWKKCRNTFSFVKQFYVK